MGKTPMPRRKQPGAAGFVFHVMNRSAKRLTLFESRDDYELFHRCLVSALQGEPIRIYAFCVMPNHFHLVLGPERDGQVASFMKRLTGRHGQLWHVARKTSGSGAVYQGRYRAVPVQTDQHFLTLCRYVERNALRAGLVARAEDWEWGSAWMRFRKSSVIALSEWPIPQPSSWLSILNSQQSLEEAGLIRRSIARGLPFGDRDWQALAARNLGLESSLRPRGRPAATRAEMEAGISST